MTTGRLALLLILVAGVAACSNAAATPTAPTSSAGGLALTAEQLAGTWRLTSMQVSGAANQTVPSGAVYTMTLENGLLSTQADCNVCNGAVSLDGTALTIGPALACTRAACQTMAFESAYTSMLTGTSTVSVAERTLILSSTRGILTFTREQ